MDIKTARNWYNWLWFSPILTIPTLSLFYDNTYDEVFSVLMSAGWHLILLIPITNKRDQFISWHGRQAMLLVGLRTLTALIFHEDPILAAFLLLIIWFFGTLLGQSQAKKGKCTLMQWFAVSPVLPIETEEKKETSDSKEVEARATALRAPALAEKIISPKELSLCPKCGDLEKTDDKVCSSCGESYAPEDVLRLRQLEFLLEQTKSWGGTEEHRTPYMAELSKLRERLFPPQQDEIKRDPQEVAKELAPLQAFYDLSERWLWSGKYSSVRSAALKKICAHLSPQIEELLKELAGQHLKLEKIPEEETIRFGLNSLKDWEAHLPSWDFIALRDHLNDELTKRTQPEPDPVVDAAPAPLKPVPAKAVAATVAKPAVKKAVPTPRPTPKPKPAPKPKRPPIQWGKLWGKTVEMVVSGALLRGLLYLGAFMIVVSATILVVRFWDVFPEVLQLTLIFSVPTLFYFLGWAVRSKLKLPQAGDVLTGIGALLVAVDFAAIYQFGGVEGKIEGNAYWLLVSVICLITYATTTWRIPGEFFDYLTLIGVGSTVLAFTRLLAIPYEWSVAVITATATAVIALAVKLSEKEGAWLRFSRATRYLPQIAIPASMTFVSFIPGASAWAQVSVFAFAAFGYALLAWKFPATIFAHAASWSMIGTVAFSLFAIDLSLEWYATAGSILAIPYFVGGKLLAEKFNLLKIFPPKTTEESANKALIEKEQKVKETKKEKTSWKRGYLIALNIAGFGLTGLSTLVGMLTLFTDLWAGVTALTIASVVLAGSAWLYEKAFLLFFGAGLFNIPFLFATHRLLQDAERLQSTIWMMTAWAGLGLAYLGVSYLLRKAEKYGKALILWAQFIFFPLLITLLVNYDPALSSLPILTALGGAILFYTLSAFLYDEDRLPAIAQPIKKALPSPVNESIFIWITGFLSILWAAAAWTGSIYPQVWMGAVFAGVALLYVALGQFLVKRNKNYRLPFHFYAYLLIFLGIYLTHSEYWSLLTTLYLSVVVFIALAFTYKRKEEVTLAALLLLFPIELSLELYPFTEHGYTLAYLLLASIIYIPVGLWLTQKKKGHRNWQLAIPVLVTGYSVSLLAVAASLFGRFDSFPIDLPWVGIVVPLLASGLYTFSVYRFQKVSVLTRLFAYLSALIFAIAFGQALTLFKVPKNYLATAWIGLGFAYLLTERGINWKKSESWLSHLRLPFGIGAAILTAFSLLLTLPFTVPAFLGNPPENLFSTILAQTLAVALLILATRLYRSRLPLFLEPFVAFFPYTLALIAHTEISTLQFGIAWSALALIHFAVAVLLDKNRIRYAHGLYLGGYILALFAISWTLLDSVTLSWTLGLGILMAIASAFLVHRKHHHTWDEVLNFLFGEKVFSLQKMVRAAFIWFIAWTFPVWLILVLKNIPDTTAGFQWLGFGIAGLVFIAIVLWLEEIDRSYTWAFHTAGQCYVLLGLMLSLPFTIETLASPTASASSQNEGLVYISLQWLGVLYYGISAWVLRKHEIYYIFSYIAAALAFFPYTMGWMFYGNQILGKPLTQSQFGVTWSFLALALIAFAADRDQPARRRGVVIEVAERKRYAHGLYLVGYLIAFFAMFWTYSFLNTGAETPHLWTLGVGILIMAGSAILVYHNHHHTWDELIKAIFGEKESNFHSSVRMAFLWFIAWTFPYWTFLLSRQFAINNAYSWIGYVVGGLISLSVAVWLRKIERTYAWSFYFSSQVYVAWALYLTSGLTLKYMRGTLPPVEQFTSPARAFVILQALAVFFYAFSAWVFQKRKVYYPFSYIAAMLSIFPATLGWTLYSPMSKMVLERYSWVWMGWAAILLLIGYLLDKGKQAEGQGRFAHGPYFVGYLLIVRAIALSTSDLLVHLYTLAVAVILALISQLLVHRQQHHALDDFIRFFWRKPESVARRVAQNFFLFFASYAVPVWVAQLLTYHEVELAWRGFVLTLFAPVYIVLGMVVRRIKKDYYTWAIYSAGYALTAIGAMVAFDDLQVTIAVLSINAAIYAISAYLFKQPAWLYLSTTLVPVITLLSLHHAGNLNDPWVSKIFMGLAFLYFVAGQLFDAPLSPPILKNKNGGRLGGGDGAISTYAMPFYTLGYLLSAVALASASGERSLAIPLYLIGSLFYAISAWRFRESLFIYPASWLLAVPYYLRMTGIATLEPRWYGLGWLPLIVLYILLGRFVFHKKPIRSPLLAHPAMPFYLLAYALSLSLVALSSADALALTLSFSAAATIYLVSAPLFRRSGWLYPGLFAAHLALLSYFTINPSGGGIHRISLPFLVMTWLMALIGYALSKRFSIAHEIEEGKYIFKFWRWEVDFGIWHFVGYLLTPSWSQPFFIFTALDIVLWQSVSLPGTDTAIILAMGYALLLGLFAMLWADKALTYGSLAFLLLAVGYRIHWSGVSFPWAMALFGGIGFGFYLISLTIEQVERRASRLSIWKQPLVQIGIALSAFATIFSLPFVASETSATAAALAFAGALYLAIAYKGKYHRLGYVGMGMLLLAWVLLLIVQDVSQPQWYAIPAGLYFTGMGHLERMRGRGVFAKIVEGFGLAVLLVTSYVQSVVDAAFVYFLILLIEGVLVLWWGAGRRQRLPFFAGIGAIALNVTTQVIVLINIYDVNRWITILGVGLLFVTAAIFVERQREKIIARSQEWRETLDTWE